MMALLACWRRRTLARLRPPLVPFNGCLQGRSSHNEVEDVPLSELLRPDPPKRAGFGLASRSGGWERSRSWHDFADYPESRAARARPPPPRSPPGCPPINSFRQWVCSDGDNALLRSQEKFTVASYNILAAKQAYSKRRMLFGYAHPNMLDWRLRKTNILGEITYWHPDVVCLQEVDRYEDLQHEMAMAGYDGVYKARTGDATDGCATFWNRERFRMLQEDSIQFSDVGLRDNVAQLCVLQLIVTKKKVNEGDNTEAGADTNIPRCVIVGNIHVLFNPKRGDIKLGQVRTFLEHGYSLSAAWNGAPVVLAGDFNSTPESSVYRYITTSELDLSRLDRRQLSGQEPLFQKARHYIQNEVQLSTSSSGEQESLCSVGIESAESEKKHDVRTYNMITGGVIEESLMTTTEDLSVHVNMESLEALKIGSVPKEDGSSYETISTRELKLADRDNLRSSELTMDRGIEQSLRNIMEEQSRHINMGDSEALEKEEIETISKEDGDYGDKALTEVGSSCDQSISVTESKLMNRYDVRSSDVITNRGIGENSRNIMEEQLGHANMGASEALEKVEIETIPKENGDYGQSVTGSRSVPYEAIDTMESELAEREDLRGIAKISRNIAEGQLGGSQAGFSWPSFTNRSEGEAKQEENEYTKRLAPQGLNDEDEYIEQFLERTFGRHGSGPVFSPLTSFPKLQMKRDWSEEELQLATGDRNRTIVRHDLRLKSAYAEISGTSETRGYLGEPLATSFNTKFKGTVDYLWYSEEGLKPVRVLDTVPTSGLEKMNGFISYDCGSDHIPIICELAFISSKYESRKSG